MACNLKMSDEWRKSQVKKIVAKHRRIRVKVIFDLCDGWIGYFWDKKQKRLYLLPVPWLGLVVIFPKPNELLKAMMGKFHEDERS